VLRRGALANAGKFRLEAETPDRTTMEGKILKSQSIDVAVLEVPPGPIGRRSL
jgi:hypothetical protein